MPSEHRRADHHVPRTGGGLTPLAPEPPEPLVLDHPRALFRIAEAVAHGMAPPPIDDEARRLVVGAREIPGAEARESMTRMLPGREVHLALQYLHDVGLLAIWLPELEATIDFSQEAGRKHKDVWEHTKQVVRQSVPRPEVRWAALLHDVGKVPTRTFTPDGGVHFHRHSEVGARMFDEVGRRFGFERPVRQKLRFLILHHLRANQYEAGWTDSAVRRFDREMQVHLDDLLDLSRADITSKRPGRRQQALRAISQLAERIEALRDLDARLPPLPTGIGNVVMERFELPPSRQIGELKRALEEAVAAGTLEPRREPEYYLVAVAKLLGRPVPAGIETTEPAPALSPSAADHGVDEGPQDHDDDDDDGADPDAC